MLSSLEHQGNIQRGTVKIPLSWWLIYPIVEPESNSQVLNIGFGSWILVQHLLGQGAATELPLLSSFYELVKHPVFSFIVKFVGQNLLRQPLRETWFSRFESLQVVWLPVHVVICVLVHQTPPELQLYVVDAILGLLWQL